jgi:hypothetical protein
VNSEILKLKESLVKIAQPIAMSVPQPKFVPNVQETLFSWMTPATSHAVAEDSELWIWKTSLVSIA